MPEHKTIIYTPTFLANAPLGGNDRKILFDGQARKFFTQNKDVFRRNWRTDTSPVDRDFGAGLEPAFRCLCGRWLPLVLAQVDHVATQKDLSGNNPQTVRVNDTLYDHIAMPMQKHLLVVTESDRTIRSVRATYTVSSFSGAPSETSHGGPVVSDVLVVGPEGKVRPDPVAHGARVTANHRAFCVRAFSDQSRASGRTWPVVTLSPRMGQNGPVGQGAVYFEYSDARIRPATIIHAIGPGGRTGLSMPFADLLKTDLTNFQLLCSKCNSSKGENSFRYVRNAPASNFFEALI